MFPVLWLLVALRLSSRITPPRRSWQLNRRPLVQALRNLKRLGCGPWPYWASLIYLLGSGLGTGVYCFKWSGGRLQAFVGAVLGACMSVALVCKQACWFLECGVAAAGADPEPTSIFYSPRSSRSKRPTVRRTSLTLHICMPRTYCLSTQARARATEASQPEF